MKKSDWPKIKTGTYFTAVIVGKKAQGMIYNEPKQKRFFYCQNVACGLRSPNKLGYNYSWVQDYNESLKSNSVKNLKFPKRPRGLKLPKFVILSSIAGYIPDIQKGHVKFGCQTVTNKQIRQLVKHLKD